jgi:hypothetical protein
VEAEVIQAALKVLHAEEAPTAGPGTDRGGGLSLQRPPANLSGAGLAYRGGGDNLSVRGVADYDRGRVFEKRTAGLRGV